MKKHLTKTVMFLIIIPPIFMAAVIYRYEMTKRAKDLSYFRKEVEYERPVANRTPATNRKEKQQALLHEAFSR